MPYDPPLPQAGTEIDAVQMRAQLNGLKDLIDAIQTISAAQVDAVNTVPPENPAAPRRYAMASSSASASNDSAAA